MGTRDMTGPAGYAGGMICFYINATGAGISALQPR